MPFLYVFAIVFYVLATALAIWVSDKTESK